MNALEWGQWTARICRPDYDPDRITEGDSWAVWPLPVEILSRAQWLEDLRASHVDAGGCAEDVQEVPYRAHIRHRSMLFIVVSNHYDVEFNTPAPTDECCYRDKENDMQECDGSCSVYKDHVPIVWASSFEERERLLGP